MADDKNAEKQKNMEELAGARRWLQAELDACATFWLRHGMDGEHGGVYTCLDRAGRLYAGDKSVWMQGRCAWTFSALCLQYGARAEWLDAARSCLDFLEAHCVNRQAGNRLYFTVTAEGRPLRQRRYCFSEAFYAMGNAAYYQLTGEQKRLDRARAAYELLWNLNNGLTPDPTGIGPKTIPQTRRGVALADPMISLNVAAILRRADPERAALYDDRAAQCARRILDYHDKPDLGCVLETVSPDGTPQLDTTAGRVVNPGHDIECSWFLLEYARQAGDAAVYQAARRIFDNAFDAGWDKEYGGLLYFLDCLGMPPESYEHDMKLWWPHNEALIAAITLYRDTGEGRYLDIFRKTLAYCKAHFADPEHGEWYGYLRRDGLPTQPPCKGSTFKGPFHLPRSLMMAEAVIGGMLSTATEGNRHE